MKNIVILLILNFTFQIGNAQEIKVETDSATGGRLIVDTNSDIAKLIQKENCSAKKTNVPTPSKENSSSSPSSNSPEDLCTKYNSISGFMIYVGYSKSETEINSKLSEFRKEFPEMRTEIKYLRPDWRLYAGDFLTKKSGQADLKRVKKQYSTAVLVPWRIYCNRAK